MGQGFDTLAIHGGYSGDEGPATASVPIYRSAAYHFKDTAHAADLFALKTLGPIYTRIGNPTQEVLETRMALLEGGSSALALASGTSAIFYTVINLCSAGDEIVSSKYLYGGTFTMFNNILPQFGIKTTFIDTNDKEALTAAITDKTKLVFCETLGNPVLVPADIQMIADTAHAAGIPLVADATFTTPYLFKPMEFGADIVVHSLTKWLGGHGTAIGGIVVEQGDFDWNTPRFPLFSTPDDSYHGITWGADLGDLQKAAFTLRMRTVPLRNLGACISPDNAWQFLQGLETLGLRMERHSSNARIIAEFLKTHSKVSWVRYPGLEDDPGHEIATRYFCKDRGCDVKGYGGMVVFGVQGGREAGEKMVNSCRLFSHLANVGDAKSLIIHPGSTTHSQLSDSEQLEAGIAPEMVRLSAGLEDPDDLLADLEQALA